jgi:hypothetical protein
MTDQEFRKVYPLIAGWIKKTLAAHASAARPVASLGFSRLPNYYDAQLLASSMVVLVPRVPMPPLSAMGLDRFREFEQMDAGGITYLNTYFVRADQSHSASLHFHELVHVLQWRLLGPGKFLALYADGLERFGYRKSPLERMAFRGMPGHGSPTQRIIQMKDAQKPDHISLNTLITRLKEGRFLIPDFQREFEWRPWDISALSRADHHHPAGR